MDIQIKNFREELKFLRMLMNQAGSILMQGHGKPSGIRKKEDGTPVTYADKAVSELLSTSLGIAFPGYGIVDEERADDKGRFSHKRCWFIDPLDDTKGYIEGTDDFGILIGLTENYQPVFGATYKPRKDELVFAARGEGAYFVSGGNTARLKASDSAKLRVLVSSSRRSDELDDLLRIIRPDSVAYMGGSLKIIEVAKGTATAFICPKSSTMSLWDLCATSVALEEAGGSITDLYGGHFDYKGPRKNYNGVIAATSSVYDSILEKISLH